MLGVCGPVTARAAARVATRGSLRGARARRGLATDIVQHRPSPENPVDGKFEFSKESWIKVETILKKYPPNYKRSAVIPLLYVVQEQCGNWVPLAGMNKIAEVLDMAPIRVYEVATFYTMFNRSPVGKYHLQLCGTTPCQLCGAEEVRGAIEKHLGIHVGETTPDKLFTLAEVECLGACVNAPMMQINNEWFYENLTPQSVVKLLDDLRAGRAVTPGPLNGQSTCAGPQGHKTLLDVDSIKPVSRDLDKVKADYERAKAEAAAKAAAAAAPKAP
jgi:NADH dehydrogenase (ubiquinone) flavoprotein 2